MLHDKHIIQKTQKRKKRQVSSGTVHPIIYTRYSGMFKAMNYVQKHNYKYGNNIKKC